MSPSSDSALNTEQFHLFERIVTAISDKAIAVHPTGEILLATPKARQDFNLPSSAVGESLSDVFPGGDRLLSLCAEVTPESEYSKTEVERIYESEEEESKRESQPTLIPRQNGAELIIDDDGHRRYFEVNAHCLSEFEFVGTLLTFREASEHHSIRSNLRNHLTDVADLLSIISLDGRILLFSSETVPRPTEMDRVANSNAEYIFDCVHPDDVGELEDALSALCKKRTIERQVRLSSHSGEWKHFDLTLRKRLLQDGSMECSITGTDITDDHQYQQHRQVLNRVLRHNLRNDLNVISGHALVLRDEDIDSKVTNHADVIHRNADSLSDLVEKVRTITQEVYGADQQVSVTNIADVIREEIAEVRNDERDAEFRTELEEIPTAGNQLLRIAIKNILENAIEHNPSRHPIVNVVSEYDTDLDRVIVRIADNGTGIPPGEVQAISRGRESQLEHTSGVGLWITKWIANGLGGTVLFNTDSSEWGTVVEFSLQPAR